MQQMRTTLQHPQEASSGQDSGPDVVLSDHGACRSIDDRMLKTFASPLPGVDVSPVRRANSGRNAGRPRQRAAQWRGVRSAAWELLEGWLPEGADVLVVGAGNGDDLPLAELAVRARRLDLLDIDGAALAAARRRLPRRLRRRTRALLDDVTSGAADRVVRAVATGAAEELRLANTTTLGEPPYDIVVGDLLYTQLLYPALLDAGLSGPTIKRVLASHGTELTRSIVERMHRSSRTGIAAHIHDAAGWWNERPQPIGIEELLAAGSEDPAQTIAMLDQSRLRRPVEADPRAAVAALGGHILDKACWRWPFQPGVDYLVIATVARLEFENPAT
jgi:hypothetical protein